MANNKTTSLDVIKTIHQIEFPEIKICNTLGVIFLAQESLREGELKNILVLNKQSIKTAIKALKEVDELLNN